MPTTQPTRSTRESMWCLAEEHLLQALDRIRVAKLCDQAAQAERVVVAAQAGVRMASAVLDSFNLPRTNH